METSKPTRITGVDSGADASAGQRAHGGAPVRPRHCQPPPRPDTVRGEALVDLRWTGTLVASLGIGPISTYAAVLSAAAKTRHGTVRQI